jgi:hypothetical protein
MHKFLPKDAAWSKQFPSPVVANGHSRWHAPESAHQLRRPDCSKDIKLDISIRSFSRKPRKSSDKIIREWKVKKDYQNIYKYLCPGVQLSKFFCPLWYRTHFELYVTVIINYGENTYVVKHLKNNHTIWEFTSISLSRFLRHFKMQLRSETQYSYKRKKQSASKN